MDRTRILELAKKAVRRLELSAVPPNVEKLYNKLKKGAEDYRKKANEELDKHGEVSDRVWGLTGPLTDMEAQLADLGYHVDFNLSSKTPVGKLTKLKTSDKKIINYISNTIVETVTLNSLKKATFTKSASGIDINYIDGRSTTSHIFNTRSLQTVGMALEEFAEWLTSKGAKQVKPPKKSKPMPSVYD